MDRNMRHSYSKNGGLRPLPHNMLLMKGRHPGAGGVMHRLSPPREYNNNNHANTHHDDLINYIYESWNNVKREMAQGGDSTAQYYQDAERARHLAEFRPFNLEEWWGRRFMLKRQQHHRS